MDHLLEGDKLKPGELNMLTCMKDFEAVTDFTSMTEKEKDGHIYILYLVKFQNTNQRSICENG